MVRTVACLLREIKATIPEMLPFNIISPPDIRPVRRRQQEGLLERGRLGTRPSAGVLSEHCKIWYDRALWEAHETHRSRASYHDIETTDASPETGEVMVVGLHREGKARSLVLFGLSSLATTLHPSYSR